MKRLLTFCLLSAPLPLHAAETVLSNEFLTFRLDPAAGAFAVADRGAAKPFVTNGRLPGTVKAIATQDAVHATFGKGSGMVVTLEDGSRTIVELFPKLPFVLLHNVANNGTAAETDLASAVTCTFDLDLGKPASALTTMGTGGLLPPDKNPGSYLFLTCADPATREGVVAGYVSQLRGSGVVFSSVTDGKVSLKARLDHGHLFLKPGQTATLDTFAIGHFADARLGSEQFADALAANHHIKLRPKSAVYCSWYAEGKGHGGAGNETTTRELAKFVADRKLADYGLGVIQLDDWWQDGPKVGGPATEFGRVNPKGPYPNGISPVAAELTKNGVTMGLWWLPFGRNHDQPNYKDKQDWFVKWPDGKPLRQKSFGGTCLDVTHPEVRDHLLDLSRTIRQWGVKYYKMDGLVTGAGVDHVYINDGYKDDRFGFCQPLHDRTKTNIEALRMGMETLRQGAGGDVFFSGCCAVQNMRMYAGTIGLVDSMRVGPDFNHDGQGIRSGPLRGSRLYFLNGRVWWNDPDPTKVRTSAEGCEADGSINGAVSLAQARLTSSWVSLTNQFYLISDWLPNLPDERLDILKRTMAGHHGTARPVDYFDSELATAWLVSDKSSGAERHVLGLFNFHGQPLKAAHGFARLGLDPAATYHAFDFWDNKLLPDVKGSYQDEVPANSCRVVALRKAEGRPVLLSTSRHVTQGMLEVKAERWEANALTGGSALLAGDPCELRVRVPEGWTFDRAEAKAVGQTAAVTVATRSEPGLVRVTLTSGTNANIAWRLTFRPNR